MKPLQHRALCKKSNDNNDATGGGATSSNDRTRNQSLPCTTMLSSNNYISFTQDHYMLQMTSSIDTGLDSVLSAGGSESVPSVDYLGNYLGVTQSCSSTNTNNINEVVSSSSSSLRRIRKRARDFFARQHGR